MEYLVEDYFSFRGRLRRKDYAIKSLFLVIPIIILETIVSHSENVIVLLVLLIILIVLSVSALSLTVRRLHDFEMNGWLCLIGFIPYLNIVYWLFLVFKDGTIDSNKYGDDPKGRVRGMLNIQKTAPNTANNDAGNVRV